MFFGGGGGKTPKCEPLRVAEENFSDRAASHALSQSLCKLCPDRWQVIGGADKGGLDRGPQNTIQPPRASCSRVLESVWESTHTRVGVFFFSADGKLADCVPIRPSQVHLEIRQGVETAAAEGMTMILVMTMIRRMTHSCGAAPSATKVWCIVILTLCDPPRPDSAAPKSLDPKQYLGNPGFQKKGYEEESAIFPPSPGKIGMLKFLVFRVARQELKC